MSMSCKRMHRVFIFATALLGLILPAGGLFIATGVQAAQFGLQKKPLDRYLAPSGRIQSIAVFGNDDRRRVPKRYRQLTDRIGLLYNSRARTLCTAFCVAPNVAATAAHCIFRRTDWGPQPLKEFWFELRKGKRKSQTRIAGAANKAGMQNIIAGTTKLRVRPPIDAANDWALIRLAKPICTGKTIAVRGISAKALEAAAGAGRVFQISYHRDYEHWKLAYSRPCQVRRQYRGLRRRQIRQEFTNPGNLLLHRCDTAGASSGSPLLLASEAGPVAVGINVGTYVQSRKPVRNSRVAREAKARTIANTGVNAAAFRPFISRMERAKVLANHSTLTSLQVRLRELNLYGGPIDGIFGNMTRAAIQAYERSRSEPQTGLPTLRLLDALGKAPPVPRRKPYHGANASVHPKSFAGLRSRATLTQR